MNSSNIPLYIQVSNKMRDNIRIEKWKPGDKIPTEYELCDIFHVSRITVRKAIDELVKENLLIKRKPKGTFVASHQTTPKEEKYTMIKSFTREMQEIGVNIKTLYVDVSLSHADPRIAKFLNVDLATPVVILKRLRGEKGHAFAYFITYFKYDERFSLKNNDYSESFYAYLESLGIKITKTKEIVEAVLPNREISKMLKITQSTPVLKRTRFTSNSDESFYEYTECYYIGSEYKYFLDFL